MTMMITLTVSLALLLTGCDSSPTTILMASKPSGAVILMNDVEIGETPMEVAVNEEMQIEIRKPGYVPYKAVMSPKDSPNLLVKLEPDIDQAESKSGAVPAVPRVPAKKSRPLNISQLKQMYNAGGISKAQYKQRVRQLKTKMDMELRALKQRYRSGQINKSQYSQIARQIEYKYKG